MRGGAFSFGKVFGAVNKFLKKNKILSRGASLGSQFLPGKYKLAGTALGGIAKQLGYGRCGGGLKLAGSGLSLSGGMRRRRRRRY
tara:strand:- start:1979 stop:2233 length:255 start_codon:yes stop_codon:yes gene_type:complete